MALPVAILVIGLPVGIGTVMAMGDHSEPEEVSPFTSVSQSAGPHRAPRAQPRWERVSAMAGTGSAQRDFTIAARAIQWRADWSCTAGTFRMSVGRPSQAGEMLASSDCPDVGTEGAMGTGRASLQVSATGGWRVVVKQQVDTALDEPPLPGHDETALARSSGRFHDVQNGRRGDRRPSIGWPADGSRCASRTSTPRPSPGLRVWLSRARNVESTLQAQAAKHADAGALPVDARELQPDASRFDQRRRVPDDRDLVSHGADRLQRRPAGKPTNTLIGGSGRAIGCS